MSYIITLTIQQNYFFRSASN